MRTYSCLVASAVALWLLQSPTVRAQERQAERPQNKSAHTQFDDHDKQVTTDWYSQHKDHPPVGLRLQDRLSPQQEQRLRPGQPVPSDLRKREHAVPSDLAHRLPPPPPQHRYVAVGGHVALVNQATHVLRDVIHLHDR